MSPADRGESCVVGGEANGGMFVGVSVGCRRLEFAMVPSGRLDGEKIGYSQKIHLTKSVGHAAAVHPHTHLTVARLR